MVNVGSFGFPSKEILIPLVVVAVSAVFMGVYGFGKETAANPFRNRQLLQTGLTMPTIWLYYDTSDVNSRWWEDFGARSSRVVNMPFLNLCYETIVGANKANYQVQVVSGLTDLASRLGGWKELPRGLQNPLANVGKAEINWIRATLLARFGGLWVNPATICLRPFPVIPYEKAVFFGTDPDESYAGPGGVAIPSLYVMGAGRPGHPVFTQWAAASFERLDKQGGGQQIRSDAKWDYVAFAQTSGDVEVYPNVEVSRRPDGKRIQIEDLLMAGQEGSARFGISSSALYAPIPWAEIRERRMYGWFLRMSEEQILNSDLAVSDIFRATGRVRM
jgi:hypothetical protein